MELKTVDFSKKEFECGGRKFYIQDSLSFNRYRELQRLSIEFGFSRTFRDLFKDIQKVYGQMQTAQNYADAAVTLYNIIAGVAMLEEKNDPALTLCALFINEADEDITVYNEIKIKEKIDCWAKELDVTPFFHLACNLADGWLPAYKLTISSILKEDKGRKETSIKNS